MCIRDRSYGYSFAMANGCIEIVDASLLGPFGQDTRKLIRSNGFEAAIIDHLPVALKLYRQIGCEPPFFLSISLLSVKDYKLGVSNQAFPNNNCLLYTSKVFSFYCVLRQCVRGRYFFRDSCRRREANWNNLPGRVQS